MDAVFSFVLLDCLRVLIFSDEAAPLSNEFDPSLLICSLECRDQLRIKPVDYRGLGGLGFGHGHFDFAAASSTSTMDRVLLAST